MGVFGVIGGARDGHELATNLGFNDGSCVSDECKRCTKCADWLGYIVFDCIRVQCGHSGGIVWVMVGGMINSSLYILRIIYT